LTSSSILLFFSLLLHRYPFSFPTRRSSDLFCTVKVREIDGHDDTACRLCNRSIEICRISGERSSHNDLSVYAVNTARTFDHFPNACPYRNIHEVARLVSAVKLAAYCRELDKARLYLLDSLCHSGDRLHFDYYRIGIRWMLCCLMLDS